MPLAPVADCAPPRAWEFVGIRDPFGEALKIGETEFYLKRIREIKIVSHSGGRLVGEIFPNPRLHGTPWRQRGGQPVATLVSTALERQSGISPENAPKVPGHAAGGKRSRESVCRQYESPAPQIGVADLSQWPWSHCSR
ncbi:protein of unknown function [Hyphomicrobium sp. 1Nfss2.1]